MTHPRAAPDASLYIGEGAKAPCTEPDIAAVGQVLVTAPLRERALAIVARAATSWHTWQPRCRIVVFAIVARAATSMSHRCICFVALWWAEMISGLCSGKLTLRYQKKILGIGKVCMISNCTLLMVFSLFAMWFFSGEHFTQESSASRESHEESHAGFLPNARGCQPEEALSREAFQLRTGA